MNTVEEQHQGSADDDSGSIDIPLVELVAAIWQRRRWLAAVTVLGMFVAIGIAFLTPNQYTSVAQIMPPDQQSVSSISMLGALAGGGAMLPNGAGALLNSKTPGQVAIGVLSSHTAQNDIIDRFDLRRIYHRKLYEDARNNDRSSPVYSEKRMNRI